MKEGTGKKENALKNRHCVANQRDHSLIVYCIHIPFTLGYTFSMLLLVCNFFSNFIHFGLECAQL